jgi:hypothetical protein
MTGPPGRLPLILAILLACAPAAPAIAPATATAGEEPAGPERQGEVQIEAGLVWPLGDLAAGYAQTRRGMGAELGHQLGLRVRFYPGRRLVLSPSFAYLEFGDHDGLDADGEPFRIQASVLRYGLDLCYLAPPSAGRVRPYLGAGLAVARNKYREEFAGGAAVYGADVNALIGSLIAGVRAGSWDCSLQYDLNRFTSSRLSFAGEPLPYRWHSVAVKLGYTLPRF